MYQFEAASPLLFRQRDLFNILVSKSRLIHTELRNKGKLMREFYTVYLVVVRKQVKSSIKERIAQKLVLKTKGTIQSPREGYTKLILASVFAFL